MSKTFKPLLAPNEEVDLKFLSYPLIASTKIDGIRLIVKNGELITRSLKPIMSNAIKERFAFLAKYTKDNQIILDGELYSSSLTDRKSVV
jgi:DNA ligase 1